MNKRKIMALALTLLCGVLMAGGAVWAMSSDNYAINWNVIGGGGEPISSDNYAIRSTIGQPAAETSFSTNYELRSGYWYPLAPAAPPEEPTIAFSPESFSFSATEGGANPADQTLEIWNSGADTLDWSISDDADWLSLSPENGSSTGPADVNEVTVSVDITGMSAGGYSATITISAPGATNTPQTVPVNLTINPAAGEDNPPVAVGLDSIEDWLVIAYGYKAGEGVGGWTVYNPEWAVTHPEWNSLTTLYVGRGYWLNVSGVCDLTYGANTYELDEGWNLIGWCGATAVGPPSAEDNPDVAAGLESIEDELVMAYGYKAGEGVGGWTVYNPEWAVAHPEWNSLTTLYVQRGYWINVEEACGLEYGTQVYGLDAGWNLIGWVGW